MGALETIKFYVKNAPTTSGVYQMLDKNGHALYIGKAKNLKKRLASYVNQKGLSIRIQKMLSQVANIETITTETEAKALILEQNLIKKLSPKYNILLKDDKSFPYLVFTNHPFPRITKERFLEGDKKSGVVFGAFVSGLALNETISLLQKKFLLRSCSDNEFKSRTRPCLEYQINRCSAPCVGKISEEEYGDLLKDAIQFLKKDSDIKRHEAGLTSSENIDVFGFYREDDHVCIYVCFYREGQHFGGKAFFPKNTAGFSDKEIMRDFIIQFYQDNIPVKLLLVNTEPLEKDVLSDALAEISGVKVSIKKPLRGKKLNLVNETVENAIQSVQNIESSK